MINPVNLIKYNNIGINPAYVKPLAQLDSNNSVVVSVYNYQTPAYFADDFLHKFNKETALYELKNRQ